MLVHSRMPSLVVYDASVDNPESLNNRMEFCIMHSHYYRASYGVPSFTKLLLLYYLYPT